ncbi:unnamed protein product [Caretta caretta]
MNTREGETRMAPDTYAAAGHYTRSPQKSSCRTAQSQSRALFPCLFLSQAPMLGHYTRSPQKSSCRTAQSQSRALFPCLFLSQAPMLLCQHTSGLIFSTRCSGCSVILSVVS